MKTMDNIGNASSLNCWLHHLSTDLNNSTHLFREISRDVICVKILDTDSVVTLNEWPLSEIRSAKNNSVKLQNLILVNPIPELKLTKMGLKALNSEVKLSKIYNIPQITVPLFWATPGGGVVTHLISNGLRAITESGLGIIWDTNYHLNVKTILMDEIFEQYNTSRLKYKPTKRGGSYMLALTNGENIHREYESIPKSVYLEGLKYISGFLSVSAVAFTLEFVAGKQFSFRQLQRLYWKMKIYGLYFLNLVIFKVNKLGCLMF